MGIESNATNELVSRFYDDSTIVPVKEATSSETNECLDYGMLMVMDITTRPELSKQSVRAR